MQTPVATHATNAEAVIAHFSPLFGHTEPGINVLTFRRWIDAGRCVKKGETGFGIFVYSGGRGKDEPKADPKDEQDGKRRGRWVRVFHIAQTEICTEESSRQDPSEPPEPGAAGNPAPKAREPRPAPVPRVRTMSPKQVETVEGLIARADRASGRLAYATSTGKRWRDTLGSMQGGFRLITEDRIDLKAALQHAITVLKAFEHVTPGQTGLDYFPSGAALAMELWTLVAEHYQGTPMHLIEVLEPSAGDGALVAPALAAGACVYAIERSRRLCECLKAQFEHNPSFCLLDSHDFTDEDSVPEGLEFDAVIMNPPFDKGASAAHTRLAFNALRPGGILVSVVGEGVFSGGDRRYAAGFDSWLADRHAKVTPITGKAFEGTSASARRVVIVKP